jgi:HSP20 family protein
MADMVRRNISPGPARRRESLAQGDPFGAIAGLTTYWDPFERLEQALGPLGETRAFNPTFDVRETADSYLFNADLPGMK